MIADSSQSRTLAQEVIHESTDLTYRPVQYPRSQSRDASTNRGRVAQSTSTSRTPSAHPTVPGDTSSIAVDTGLQRRLSNKHHRQTSVINGLQHSRNPSFNSPLSASPLSPESLYNASVRSLAAGRRMPGYATELDPPMAPFAGTNHINTPSIDSTINLDSSMSISSSSIQTQSSGSRGGRSLDYSASITTESEGKTPNEYAMHHLLNAFLIKANEKIDLCISNLDIIAHPVEQICGAGADPAFDQLFRALGHVARQHPKALVDALMFWRQNKADVANAARRQHVSHKSPSTPGHFTTSLVRRNTEPLNDQGLAHPGVPVHTNLANEDFASDEYMLLDRQATVSVYMLCRGLLEVFDQSDLEAISPDLANKLEDIVFEQLRAFDPHHLTSSKPRAANWRIYGQLLGGMSRVDFSRVVARYTQQLQTWQQDIATSTGTTTRVREAEARIELLLLSMPHLRITLSTEGVRSACDFLTVIAKLFAESHGPRIKQAYCAVFEALLLQLTPRPDLTSNDGAFKTFVDVVNPRINQMLTKMRHWASALPTSIALLCLSPIEGFHAHWLSQLTGLCNKLRDKPSRVPAMRAIAQLAWTYLRRSNEATPVKVKRIEELVRLVLPQGRKPFITTDPAMLEATLFFVRLIGMFHRDLCYRLVILPLINADAALTNRDVRIEQLEPERISVGIRAFMLVIEDQEKGLATWPDYPKFDIPLPPPDAASSSPMPFTASRLPEQPNLRPVQQFGISPHPVNMNKLDDVSKVFFRQFCDVLGKVVILCDGVFGSSATFNERLTSATPKTPLVDAFSINKRDESTIIDQKIYFYDLLDVAIQALPRCLAENVALNPLVNLLCTASAHVQPHIALSATRSLKSIAQQGNAQLVATSFPRFIFNYDHQYSTMSEEGRLGSAHIEATLTLYLDLLQIWSAQLQKKFDQSITNDSNPARALQMEMLLPVVEEIEGYGLFFMCSQSRKVRSYAVKVLQTVFDFDRTLKRKEHTRIISVLETHADQILDIAHDELSPIERSRLQKDRRRKVGQSILLEVCISENYYDSALWYKAFPNVIRFVFEQCPHAAALSREYVCDRLALMLSDVERISGSSLGSRDVKLLGRSSDTPINVFLDQWKLYLVMACVTLNSTGGQSRGQLDNALHSRKASRNAAGLQDKLSSARSLFSAVIPLLGASTDLLRSAVVTALGSINRKLYRILLESLQYAVITCNDEAKARRGAHQRTPSSPSRSQMTDRMRIEVTCIYKLTASFLKHDEILNDEWILGNLMNYAKDLRLFLSDSDVHADWKFTRLRFHYCGLVDVVYDNIKRYAETGIYMSFESRKSAFMLMEEWCGYHSDIAHANMHMNGDGGEMTSIAKERHSLRTAALSAMATLCAGPVSVVTESNTHLQFNIGRILSWIDSIFGSAEDKLRGTGQRALKNLIIYNPGTPIFVEHAIKCCYGIRGEVAQVCCFNVLADVLTQQPHFPINRIKVFGAFIFTLGHDSRDVRMRSARLLRFLDDREQKSSNLQHFDISIADKTRAVYKAAQFEFSRRLAQMYPDAGFHTFSEFCLQFKAVSHDIQRSMVAAVLPWLQTLELQVLPNSNKPAELSYMLLVNMLEITIQSETSLYNEVQALWQALATGPHGGNVQLILDFIIDLSLERREQNFVYFAKQIVVYLSSTAAGSKIFQYFLLQLAPKMMPNERKALSMNISANTQLPYVANLDNLLPNGNRQNGLSLGQLSLIFLVDLLVPPVQVTQPEALRLLHAVFILWDHHTITVQEHARELLVHLIHSLVVVRFEQDESNLELLAKAEGLVELIRTNDSSLNWAYIESNSKTENEDIGIRVPPGMSQLASKVSEIFNDAMEDFVDSWAREALHWASVCPVRHLACRSFQVYRCISVTLDSALVSDMLARLSNTIADEHADYQTFSLEILTTLRVAMTGLNTKQLIKHPQLFWTTVACLSTIHEREFYESLGMLQQLVNIFDFADPSATAAMLASKPESWEGDFVGIESLVYKGLRSSHSLQRSLTVLTSLSSFPDSLLLGSDNRLMFNVLAHLPQIMQTSKNNTVTNIADTIQQLASTARSLGYNELEAALTGSVAIDNTSQTAGNILLGLKSAFFPTAEADALIFLLGLLSNSTTWFRVTVLDILQVLIPMLDMNSDSIAAHGADLISPLLRLLQTELCDQALKVMDLIVEIQSTPLDRLHLRMSMASGPAPAVRKEYEKTQSLYGIPEASGWSVPAPAVLSALTRKNVHHVFYACSVADDKCDTPAETPEIEFHAEEEYADSYFPTGAENQHHISFDSNASFTMGDIVNSLDSLDDFFEENEEASTPTGDTRGSGGFGSFTFFNDHQTAIYDQQTAPIISKAYERPGSSTSVHNGLADQRPPTSLGHKPQYSTSSVTPSFQTSFLSIEEDDGPGPSLPTMDKQAFPPGTYQQTSRPGLHTRSVTSPANQYQSVRPELHYGYSDPQSLDDMLSDSELSPFPSMGNSIHSATKSIGGTPTSATDASAGFMRRGMRRLTGGKSESAKEKARLRAPSIGQSGSASLGSSQSPRMPRIPSEYLNHPSPSTNSGPSPLSPGAGGQF